MNRKKNFLATVITPWQAKGVEVAIEYLKQKSIYPCGYIILLEHHITGKCVTEASFHLNDNFLFIKKDKLNFDESKNLFLALIQRFYEVFRNKSYKEHFYIINSGRIDLKWVRYVHKIFHKRAIFILIDDGTGGYTGYKGLSRQACIYYEIKNLIYKIFISILRYQDCYIDNRLMKFKRKKLEIDRNLAELYKNSLKTKDCYTSSGEKDILNGCVLINTQCFYDNNMIDSDQDISVLKILDNILKKDYQYKKVVFKTHPREKSLERYNEFEWTHFNDNGRSQEEILANIYNKPSIIIGITSSTLLNLKALFDIPTLSLAYFFLDKNLSNGVRQGVLDYIHLAKDIVLLPKNEEELRGYLNQYLIK